MKGSTLLSEYVVVSVEVGVSSTEDDDVEDDEGDAETRLLLSMRLSSNELEADVESERDSSGLDEAGVVALENCLFAGRGK